LFAALSELLILVSFWIINGNKKHFPSEIMNCTIIKATLFFVFLSLFDVQQQSMIAEVKTLFLPFAASRSISSSVNRICNVENIDGETTRFEWLVGGVSKYVLGEKVEFELFSFIVQLGRFQALYARLMFFLQVSSSPVTAGGNKWVLDFYPKGCVYPHCSSIVRQLTLFLVGCGLPRADVLYLSSTFHFSGLFLYGSVVLLYPSSDRVTDRVNRADTSCRSTLPST
jgi:hypothetical protein